MKKKGRESGEIMIEGTIVVIVTMLMLVWILGVGFLYYQKYVVRIASNDVAKKVATTYDSPTSDLFMGYISANDLTKRTLYSGAASRETNELRAESYVNYIMKQANFYGTVKDVDVELAYTKDAMSRGHIEVTTTCTFKTPFGAGLKLFGMSDESTYVVTSYADATDLSEYISTVTTAKAFYDQSIVKLPGVVNSTIKVINSLIGLADQYIEGGSGNGTGSSGGGMR